MASNDRNNVLAEFENTEFNDDSYENLSAEELSAKINIFHRLCYENKINKNNAFDIDMIGSFSTWLVKNKLKKSNDNDSVDSFQKIGDYLDASGKVYSYRVDNFNENTSKLIDQFKNVYNRKNNALTTEGNNLPKTNKPRRQKLMLTTADKLRRKPDDTNNFIDPSVKQNVFNIDFKELFETSSPADVFKSLYSDTQKKDEMKTDDIQEENNLESFFMKDLSDKVLCPAFDGFVAEKDKSENTEAASFDGVEHQFDPETFKNKFADIYNENENTPGNISFESSSRNGDSHENYNLVRGSISDLVDCIDDNVNSDYSFFNPKLLAKWNGPEAWKAQAMLKALKSCKKKEHKKITNDSDDETSQQNVKNPKTTKKRNIEGTNKIKINWLSLDEFEDISKIKVKGKEQISSFTLNKWNPFNKISDTKTIKFDNVYKFSCLKYIEIEPYWLINNEKMKIDYSEGTNEVINDDVHDADDDDGSTSYINPEVSEYIKNVTTYLESEKLNTDDNLDDDVLLTTQTRAKMDISQLKKEISQIIDEECIKTDSDDEWSSQLPFAKLLSKLKVFERTELSVPIVYVALLHLTNERGLKLFQEHCTDVNDLKPLFIAKPLNKM